MLRWVEKTSLTEFNNYLESNYIQQDSTSNYASKILFSQKFRHNKTNTKSDLWITCQQRKFCCLFERSLAVMQFFAVDTRYSGSFFALLLAHRIHSQPLSFIEEILAQSSEYIILHKPYKCITSLIGSILTRGITFIPSIYGYFELRHSDFEQIFFRLDEIHPFYIRAVIDWHRWIFHRDVSSFSTRFTKI